MSSEYTTQSTVPSEESNPEPLPPLLSETLPTGISKRWFLGTILTVLLIAFALVVAFGPQHWIGEEKYILAPGNATNAASAIIVDNGPFFPPDGEIAFTTVSIRRGITIGEWLLSKFDGAEQLVPAKLIDGDRTSEETRQVTQFQMDQSQDTATLVALNYLGYELVPEIAGAFVLQVVGDSPAAGVLELGDLITSINGDPIASSEDLGELVRGLEPGTEISVLLQRGSIKAGGDGADVNAQKLNFTITLAPHPDIVGVGFLGVLIETPVRADAPFDVSFDVGKVRGPSAGLAFSLAILDVLTDGELTGGIKVATTGTISLSGVVGAVGGIPQKIEAAKREGVDLFLVPPTEFKSASEAANGALEIRCVQTFSDAVLVLGEFGGNGISVAIEGGAKVPKLSPNPVDPDDGFTSCAEVSESA